MVRIPRIAIAVLTVAVVPCLAGPARGAGRSLEEPVAAADRLKVGDPLPAFELSALDGKTVRSESFRGRTLLLVLVRPDQERSRKAMRIVGSVARDTGESRLSVIAVFSDPKGEEAIRRFAAEEKIGFPLICDAERTLHDGLGGFVAPRSLLFDGEGILRHDVPGMPPAYERKLRLHVDLLLGRVSREEHEAKLEGREREYGTLEASVRRRITLAKRLADRGDADKAAALLSEIPVEDRPADVTVMLGTLYLDLERTEEAASCLDPLATAERVPRGARLALGRLETARGRHDAAEAHLLEALKVSPSRDRVLYHLGRLYEKTGRIEEAVRSYRQALEEVYRRSR